MNTILIACSVLLVIVAAAGTAYALKQEDRKIKKYQAADYTVKDEIKRSQEYENNSVSKYNPIQIWTYVIGLIVTLILIAAFAIYY